jgi:hypothetical protein
MKYRWQNDYAVQRGNSLCLMIERFHIRHLLPKPGLMRLVVLPNDMT